MSSIFSYSLRPAWTASDEDRLEEDDEEEDGCVLTPMLGFQRAVTMSRVCPMPLNMSIELFLLQSQLEATIECKC